MRIKRAPISFYVFASSQLRSVAEQWLHCPLPARYGAETAHRRDKKNPSSIPEHRRNEEQAGIRAKDRKRAKSYGAGFIATKSKRAAQFPTNETAKKEKGIRTENAKPVEHCKLNTSFGMVRAQHQAFRN